MNKLSVKVLSMVCAAGIMAAPLQALAADTSSADGHGELNKWYVHFTQDEKMDDNLTSGFYDPLSELQPGDTVYFEVSIRNDNASTTDWYLDNEIVRSLEDYDNNRATNGGAYTYILEYIPNSGNTVTLYSSDTVGGDKVTSDGSVGLHQAAEQLSAEELQDFSYLTTLKNGEGGKVRLTVALDGETQGNDYQYTMARARIRFAVTKTPEKEVPTIERRRRTIVKTGDEFNMWPYFAVAFFSGALLLMICIFRVVDKKNKKKGGGTNA